MPLPARRSRARTTLIALDIGVDTTTPSGEMLANVLAVFAQFERRLIGQRTREALAVRRSQGIALGRPRVLPDTLRRRVASQRKAGMSLRAIAEALNERGVETAHGGRRWYASTVRYLLDSIHA